LIVEAPLFGVTLLWVSALLPAAVVTLLKRRWLLFGVGWISLGCGWLIGAALLAPPDSPWARWFYGERRMRLGTFGARPAPVLGVSGAALQRSVSDSPLENPAALGPCRRLAPGEWRCLRVPPRRAAPGSPTGFRSTPPVAGGRAGTSLGLTVAATRPRVA